MGRGYVRESRPHSALLLLVVVVGGFLSLSGLQGPWTRESIGKLHAVSTWGS